MSKTDVWMPWYPSDYLKRTIDLSLEEDAIYRRALDYLWQNPVGLPLDMVRLCRCLRVSENYYEKCTDVLGRYLENNDGFYKSERVNKEREKANRRAEASRNNGKSGGRPSLKVTTQTKPTGLCLGNLDPNLEKSSPQASLKIKPTACPSYEEPTIVYDEQKKVSTKRSGQSLESKHPPETRSVLDYFRSTYENSTNQKLAVSWSRDMKIMGNLVKNLGDKEVARRIDIFFDTIDPFYDKAGRDLKIFASTINKLVSKSKSPEKGATLWDVKIQKSGTN